MAKRIQHIVQLSLFDCINNVQLLTDSELIAKVNTTGQYKFPFKEGSFEAKAILHDEIETTNSVIISQRIMYKAALMVVNGECVAINPALRKLGYNI